eukprot:TRINITY_DN3855_c0_g1_i2.p1 TRINITY_DN3855_c0_g1~~TRINITY_DN3855_c0_g1_i2.p1  ORF type:complete len:304 (-),score=35.32 TRINITY_DN3855_c0_g1_i2:39-950(-)
MTLPPSEEAIEIVRITVATISFVLSLVVLCLILYFRQFHSFTSRLIMFLMVGGMLAGIADFYNIYTLVEQEEPHGAICILQAVQLQLGRWIQFGYALAMAVVTCFIVTGFKKEPETHELWYHVAIWILVVVMTCLPLIGLTYGADGVDAWCWIDPFSSGTLGAVWVLVAFYIPLWIIMVIICVLYAIMARHTSVTFSSIRHASSDKLATSTKVAIGKMYLYPIVLVLVWIWPTIHRIYEIATGGGGPFWLELLDSLFAPSLGALNAIVYGFTNRTCNCREAAKEKKTRSASRKSVSAYSGSVA